MKINLLKKVYSELTKKHYHAYYTDISNENLYEFTEKNDNVISRLTGFNGDTGSLLILRGKAYLFVDGRFTIQAKKEVKDKTIKVVKISARHDIYEKIKVSIKKNGRLSFNPKIESIKTIKDIEKYIYGNNIKLVPDYRFIDKVFNDNNIDSNKKLEKYPLFVIDNKYVSKNAKSKVRALISDIEDLGFTHYITSSLEEIAYLTNIRKMPLGDNAKVLVDAFMIISDKSVNLYTDNDISKVSNYLNRNGIKLFPYNKFYGDLNSIKDKEYMLDPSLNNYYIYKKLSIKNEVPLITSPLTLRKSIKDDKEYAALVKCNLVDGLAITRAIYDIKKRIKSNERLTEYDAKYIVDNYRKRIGGKNYLSPSFDTIVAYKENSAICHYSPKEHFSKPIKKNSLLLIDSGGNYIFGTTDITRTISLYDKKVPSIVKKHYTLVLNSLMTLAIQRFPYGLKGNELDVVARQNLYNATLDFDHGTGHGIGYISNVHEGPNSISVGENADKKLNVIEPYQVTSDEPGLYFENKYGIRLENDLISVPYKKNNFGDFMKFINLTICPFDRDLIDEKILDNKVKKALNAYNKMVYKKFYKRLDDIEKKMLKYDTKEFRM